MDLRERAQELGKQLPAVYLAMKDKATPFAAKAAAGLAVTYGLSPLDFIPDFIPVLGYLDDVLLLPSLIALAVRLIPQDVWDRCVAEAAHIWEGGLPKRWYFAIPVVLLWQLLLFFIVKAIWFSK